MPDRRRKIIYIDRIFQNRFLLAFLLLALAGALANVAYMQLDIKPAIEAHLYRSHIVLDNLNEIIAGQFIDFNLVMGGVFLVVALAVYSVMRFKISRFFDGLTRILDTLSDRGSKGVTADRLPEEFEGINAVFRSWLDGVSAQLARQEAYIRELDAWLESPDDSRRHQLINLGKTWETSSGSTVPPMD